MLRSASPSVTSRSTVPRSSPITIAPACHASSVRTREHDVGVVVHVGAPVRRLARRHPPQPPQPGDVVDPQPVRGPQGGPQQVAVGGVAGGVQPVGAPGRQPPVLALLAERVRRGTGVHAHREDVLQRPAVGALGVAADGEVVHDPHPDLLRHAAHLGQLDAAPGPAATRGTPPAGPAARARGRRPAPRGGAALGPPAPVGSRSARRARRRSRTATGRRCADGLGPPRRVPQQLAGRPLGRPHPVVVDPVAGGVGPQHVHLGARVVVGRAVGVEVGDPQGQGGREPPARRRVGRGLAPAAPGVMACSGLSSTASAPCSRPVQPTNSRRSPRSPMPHEPSECNA